MAAKKKLHGTFFDPNGTLLAVCKRLRTLSWGYKTKTTTSLGLLVVTGLQTKSYGTLLAGGEFLC